MSQRNFMPNMNSIPPKTKELVTFYCGCNGNLVTIATRFVADACCPKEPPYQIRTHTKYGRGTRCRVALAAVTTYVCHNFVGFQILPKSQIIEYFAGAPFSFNCLCSITQYFCFENNSCLLSPHSCKYV